MLLTRLTNVKTGQELTTVVKLAQGLAEPETYPCIIEVDKADASLSTKIQDTERGQVERRTMWIRKYVMSDEVYIDHSLDDYE